ncbi:glucoamylase family protein [Mesorhizobium sp. SP-1A]|uniref:glucoamylase family protein n=1 Tax=Mesorhizobium sp. SP-1A TaxID=3077840 RepID=UPI0028F6C88B|nr:glucoamylase family protein [Mesorhizobium sp. SP-1A]
MDAETNRRAGGAVLTDDELLDETQRLSFEYFVKEANPANGLIADRNREGSPASIAATGMALSAYPIAVERGLMSRQAAVRRTLATLRFFRDAAHGPEADATGYKGFYYHFLDMQTGRRVWKCELSTVDTALLLAGALVAGAYFAEDDEQEAEIRQVSDLLYRRADWRWAQNGNALVTHGWRPERGFLRYHWLGYDEALILYVLGLGSPTHPLPPESYAAWLSGYAWKTIYGHRLVQAGPLFIHQFSHLWIDFRGIRDAFMCRHQSDYFENSRTATYIQREYAIRNPRGFAGYHKDCWGITASDGPGPDRHRIDGRERRFFNYLARGVPYGPDDGTLSPWTAVASLPFAPEIVLPTLRHFHILDLKNGNPYGFTSSFNPTFGEPAGNAPGWVSPDHVGINQGPITLMIENHRTDFLWRLMRACPYIVTGLRRADFTGGWLEG